MKGDIKSEVLTDDELIVFRSIQDVEPHLDHAKDMRDRGNTGSSELRHAAHFPGNLVQHYCVLNGITFAEFIGNPIHTKRMLNDPDLKKFRIWEGKV